MAQFSRLFLGLLFAATVSASSVLAQSQNQATSPSLYSNTTSQVVGPTILPEAPGTVNGGNPFQGLGRPDDTGPQRSTPLQQFNPDNANTGLFTTGSSFPSTQSVEQPGFGGQAGFSSNNTSNDASAQNPALNQSSIPALNQTPAATNPGPNGALQQNLNSPAQRGVLQDPAIKVEKNDNNSSEGATAVVDKLLKKPESTKSETAHKETRREAGPLAAAIKDMHEGNYKKSLEAVDAIIKAEPKNAQAYYVKAVANVFMRDFAHARQNYEATLRYTTDEHLTEKARAGLAKLGR